MSREDVKKTIMPQLTALYPRNFGISEEQDLVALGAYLDDLEAYDEITLDEAWKRVRQSHKGNHRPSPAIIRDMCMKVKQETFNKNKTGFVPIREQEAFATEQGQLALREGMGHGWLAICRQRNKIMDIWDTEDHIKRNKAALERMSSGDFTNRDGMFANMGNRLFEYAQRNNERLARKWLR